MTPAFSIRFLINRTSGLYELQLTDASDYTGVATAYGFYRIEYPDGVFWENTTIASPDFTLADALSNIPLRMTNGKLLKGQYKITQKTYADTGDFQLEKIFVFDFVEPVLSVRSSSDLTTLIVAFTDDTEYGADGYTESITRTLRSFFPPTSNISDLELSTSGIQLTMVDAGQYYEGIYSPNLAVEVLYTGTGHEVLLIQDDDFSFAIQRQPTITEIYSLLEEAKQKYDSAKGGPGELSALRDYQTVAAIVQQIKSNIGIVDELGSSADRILAQAATAASIGAKDISVAAKDVTVEKATEVAVNTGLVLAAKVIVDEKTALAVESAEASETSAQSLLSQKDQIGGIALFDTSIALINDLTTISTFDRKGRTALNVKDLDRGGPFAYVASGLTANGGTIFNANGGGYWVRNFSGPVNVKWFGAIGNGSTNDTSAFTTSLSISKNIYIPSGHYLVNISTSGQSLIGESKDNTIIESFSATGYAITYTGIGWERPIITEIKFIGDVGLNKNGIIFGGEAYSSGFEYAGRLNVVNCVFNNLNKCIHKPYGNIGNVFLNNSFQVSNYHIYIEKDTSSGSYIMHGGCDYIQYNYFRSSLLASIYIDSPQNDGGQTIVDQNVFELNSGFICFTENYLTGSTYASAIDWRNNWNENNASNLSTTINGVSYTTKCFRFKNTYLVSFDVITLESIELVNSNIQVYNLAGELEITKDGNSSITVNRFTGFRLNNKDVLINNPENSTRRIIFDPLWATHRFKIIRNSSLIYSRTYDLFNSYTFPGGLSTKIGVKRRDGVLFGSCAEFTTTASSINLVTSTFSVPIGYAVFSLTAKKVSGFSPSLQLDGSSTLFDIVLDSTEWKTFVGISKIETVGSVSLGIRSNVSGVAVVRIESFQFLSFAEKQDAVNYLKSGAFTVYNDYSIVTYGDTAPTTGDWNVKDIIYSNTPSEILGWVCTVSGSPGIWKTIGNLSGDVQLNEVAFGDANGNMVGDTDFIYNPATNELSLAGVILGSIKTPTGNLNITTGGANGDVTVMPNGTGKTIINSTIGTGVFFVNTGSGLNVDIAASPINGMAFGNLSGVNGIPVILGKSNTAQGLFLMSATNNTNAEADMDFGVRENDNTDFLTLTSAAFRFRRFSTTLVNIMRNGNFLINNSDGTDKLDVNGTFRVRTRANATGNFGTWSATGVAQERTPAQSADDILKAISGYSAGVAQKLEHDSSGNITWVNI